MSPGEARRSCSAARRARRELRGQSRALDASYQRRHDQVDPSPDEHMRLLERLGGTGSVRYAANSCRDLDCRRNSYRICRCAPSTRPELTDPRTISLAMVKFLFGDARPQFRRMPGWAKRRSAGLGRVPWVIAVPGILFLIAYHLAPVVAGAGYAFTDWNGFGDARFVGVENFRQVFREPATRGALWHTIELATAFFVIVNALGLALALGLNRALKSRNVLRSLFFAPVVISPIATAFIWQYIFDYQGALNNLLGAAGLESWQRPWLGDPTWALWTVLIVMVWQYSGLTMVIYLAGLQGIPDELIEASAVDGARLWMRFRRIVLPLLAPAITVCATLTLIIGLRAFEQVIALTGGGPVGASETLATQVWKQTFVNGRFGFGSALSLVLTGLIAVLALTQLAVLRAREERL